MEDLIQELCDYFDISKEEAIQAIETAKTWVTMPLGEEYIAHIRKISYLNLAGAEREAIIRIQHLFN